MAMTAVAAFCLGLCAIDMHCDHWSLSGTPTKTQLSTCVAYYQNMNEQPLYIQAIILSAILVGVVSLASSLLSSKRTFYDILTLPFFGAVLFFFLGPNGVVPVRESLSTSSVKGTSAQQVALKSIATNHAYIIGLLSACFILQTLATTARAKYTKRKTN